jgi:hypothetical protein
MAKASKNPLKDLEGYRRSVGENQATFWGRFGVTQSGGSRYEAGRPPPKPVVILLIAFACGFIEDDDLKKAGKSV